MGLGMLLGGTALPLSERHALACHGSCFLQPPLHQTHGVQRTFSLMVPEAHLVYEHGRVRRGSRWQCRAQFPKIWTRASMKATSWAFVPRSWQGFPGSCTSAAKLHLFTL